MSPTLFRADGTVYDQMQVFDSGYRVNETAFEEYGPPHMAVSEIFSFFTTAVSAHEEPKSGRAAEQLTS